MVITFKHSGAGLCPDWQDWSPKDAIQNATEAMGLADDWLNVRQVCLHVYLL